MSAGTESGQIRFPAEVLRYISDASLWRQVSLPFDPRADAGGRYGTTHVDLTTLNPAFTFARLHAAIGGAYVGASYGVDVPLGGYVSNFGVRGEYANTNSDILRMNSDQHELSLF